jgi:hypothetical protein
MSFTLDFESNAFYDKITILNEALKNLDNTTQRHEIDDESRHCIDYSCISVKCDRSFAVCQLAKQK